MNKLITKIEALETKQENGTITMDEQVILHKLIELAEGFIYSK